MNLPVQPPADPSAPKPRSASLSAMAAVVVLVAVGVVVWQAVSGKLNGSPTGASGPAITGAAVEQILLDEAELTAMLGQPFKQTPVSPVYGGFEAMDNSAPTGGCGGVLDVAQQSAYRSADVQSFARETWPAATTGPGDGRGGTKQLSSKVMFVKEAVVALPSAEDARELFAKFVEEWKHCDGQEVNEAPDVAAAEHRPHLAGSEMRIVDVRVTDDVLAASIVLNQNPKAPDTRAVGVQDNCIVGVLIAFTGTQNATGSGDPATSSSAAVRAMMGKVEKIGEAARRG